MSKVHLLFKIIRQLKVKAVLLLVITLAAEAAVVYIAGLYRLPKQYQSRLSGISKDGSCVYFDTLGRRADVESLLSGYNSVEDILYVSYVANLKYNNELYYLKAVSSEKCFGNSLKSPGDNGKDTNDAGDNGTGAKRGKIPSIVSSRLILQGDSAGDMIPATVFKEDEQFDTEFSVRDVLSEDSLVMNFQVGSNRVSAYNIFAPCGKDVYVIADDSLEDLLFEKIGFDRSVLYPSNGIVLFKEDSDRELRLEVINTLLANDIGVQDSSEIEETTRIVSKNNIDVFSAIPLLTMALSLAASFAIIVMSIDSEAKTIALIELVGCSKTQGNVLLITAFSVILLPGILLNSAFILTSVLLGKQLIDNVLITPESFLQLGITVLAFLAIITVSTLFLKRQNSHVQRVIEEI